MAIQPVSKTKYTVQTIMNFAFDEVFKVIRYVQHIYNPTTGAYQAKEEPFPCVTKIDSASAPILYIGKAANGTATSVELWQIQKLNTVSSVMTIQFADGNKEYEHEWDERGNLNYS